ncbi:MAG: UbiA family prenyltransferase [Maioricimonas sp. JB049]
MASFRSYLQLCRAPAVFTAMADIFLGFLLVHRTLSPLPEFIALLLASTGLYLAGMVFNDVFDREQDARERPQRPIPSGRISLRAAVTLGSLLVVGGLACAALAGIRSGSSPLAGTYSINPLLVALILTGTIFAYDSYGKRTPLGPVLMGACRFFNVILGASSADPRFVGIWGLPQLWVAAGLGVYIIGVTWFARTEATVSKRSHLIGSTIVADLGLLSLVAWLFNWGGGARPEIVALLLAVIILTINRRLFAAIFDPAPQKVQTAVRTMLMSLIMLDASLIYFKLGPEGVPFAIATALLLVPSILLGRWMSMT